MQNRHPLELSLVDAINQHDAETAIQLIDILKSKNQGPSLSSRDNKGSTFLHLALQAGERAIVDKLLGLQGEDDNLLFSKNENNQSLCALAAQRGYHDVVEYLVKRAMQAAPGSLGHEIWLRPEKDGNSPLSYAVAARRVEVVKYLLTVIAQDENFINHLNRFNVRKNTPLHQALFTETHAIDIDIVAMLIQAGADLALVNDEKGTPLTLLCQQPVSMQTELFAKLNKTKQAELLQHYRSHLLSHSLLDKQIYYTLAGMHGLKTLAAAKLEFDDEIEIRNVYKKASGEEDFIPDQILDLAPLYGMRVRQAEGWPVTEPSKKMATSTLFPASYQILNDDVTTFASLIADVEIYLADLQTRPTIPLSNKALVGLTVVMLLAVYVGVETWLGVMSDRYHDYDNPNSSQYRDYDVSMTMFGTIFPIFLAMIGAVTHVKWQVIAPHLETRIHREEWKSMLDNLRTSVLEKLQHLEEMESQDNTLACLPVSVQTVRELEGNLDEFEVEKKPLHEVIDMLQRLDTILQTIQHGMLVTNKPLSLFFKPAHEAIEMRQLVDDELDMAETARLLS